MSAGVIDGPRSAVFDQAENRMHAQKALLVALLTECKGFPTMKDRRQRAILTLVATRPIHSQEELVRCLQRQGFEVTQATVSRDIKELGLAKVPIKTDGDGDDLQIRRAECGVNYVSRLHRAMAELSTTIAGSANLIVIATPPGQRDDGGFGGRRSRMARSARYDRRRRHDLDRRALRRRDARTSNNAFWI